MAMGKNPRLSKGKKGGKKKVGDPFAKKEWYDIKVPNAFTVNTYGYTPVNKTAGMKTSSSSLLGRVFELNMADLHEQEELGFRKVKLICEEIEGRHLLTDFNGMDMTRDKLCSLIRKWHTLIEAECN
eukprot:Trichotokara_eunicae@DN5502_c0_g2_i1.p1